LGFLDAILGGRGKLKSAQPTDKLFAIGEAQITLETELGLKHRNAAGIVFQPIATADFQSIIDETEELLRSSGGDTGTTIESHDDEFGYRWIVLRDPDFEDLVVSLNMISTQLANGGYGDRLLAAVFAFEERAKPLYFIYNFKRAAFYPFVPAPGEKQRNNERELQLKAQAGDELPFEPELERWFPLWEIPL
jgi:hypothetical protein